MREEKKADYNDVREHMSRPALTAVRLAAWRGAKEGVRTKRSAHCLSLSSFAADNTASHQRHISQGCSVAVAGSATL